MTNTSDTSLTAPEKPYSPAFFTRLATGAASSAQVVVPLLCDLISPASVVDVGCGTGHWLQVFEACGVRDILGIDGDYVPREKLAIDPTKFLPYDLTKRLKVDREFDLATSFEVAEHLPERNAQAFVDGLCDLAPVVAFSAAVPGQEGNAHLNERWPAYWQKCFAQHGYDSFDLIRPKIWTDPRVEWWYRQNLFIFVSRQAADLTARMRALEPQANPLTLVKESILQQWLPENNSVAWHFRQLLAAIKRGIQRRMPGK